MGDFSLGALIGANQSFEDTTLSGWSALTAQGSASTTALAVSVHSSTNALFLQIFSSAINEQGRRYDYFSDYTLKAFRGVHSHHVVVDGWGRSDLNSVGFLLELGGLGISSYSPSFPFVATALARRQVSGYAALGVNSLLLLDAQIQGTYNNSAYCLLDDVLARVDEITLYPEWDFAERARLLKAEHRTQGGLLHTYVWEKHFAYSVPLRFLADSHAALLNWWWENQFNLALTLDSSDSESTRIVRITNDRQPIGRRMRPYADRWEGVIELESIDRGSLVF